MTIKETAALNRIFHALSDPTRREILMKLAEGQHTITELAKPYSMTFAAVSKHIRVLEDAGLIRREVDGRIHRCNADLEPLKDAAAFIDKYKRYWESRLDALDSYFKKTGKQKKRDDG